MAKCLSQSVASLSLADSSIDFDFAKKNPGQKGRRLQVIANFAKIKINANSKVFVYNIEITVKDRVENAGDARIPQRNRLKHQKRIIDGSNFNIFNRLYEDNNGQDGIFTSEPIFDGRKIIYSRTPLNIDGEIIREVRIRVPEKKFPLPFIVRITTPPNHNQIDLSKLNDLNIRAAEKELQALDIIITYGAKKFNLFINSNMFRRKADLLGLQLDQQRAIRFNLGDLKEASFGSYQACKLTERGIQLNVDRAAAVFKKSGKLIPLIEEYIGPKRQFNRGQSGNRGGRGGRGGNRGGRGGNHQYNDNPPFRIDDRFRFQPNEREKLNGILKGLSFVVNHIRYQPKNTIYGLSSKPISEITFEFEGRITNVKAYFEAKYRSYIEQLGRELFNLPCIQVGKTNEKFFPLEVVEIVDDQPCMEKLDPTQQATMTSTCGDQSPVVRFSESNSQIQTLIESSRRCQTDYLRAYGIEISKDFEKVNARYLDPPKLCGLNDKDKVITNGEWSDASFARAAQIEPGFKWIVVNYTKDITGPIRFAPDENSVKTLVKAVVEAAGKNGLRIGEPSQYIYNEEFKGKLDMKDAFEDYLRDHPGLRFILFIIPDGNASLYGLIKYFCELVFGLVSQCANQKKSRKFSDWSYAGNIVLKINSKLSGINAHLKKESRIGHLGSRTMIMGLDVTHPSKNDRIANSIASATCTFDKEFINYYVKSVVQPPRKEIIDLKNITLEFLNNFKEKNKNNKYLLPANILVYRDGVSEGMFDEVINREINMMKSACREISIKDKVDFNPKITYIIVQKRHHVRFLPVDSRDRDHKSQNSKPGLVVDNSIASNFFNDFYLTAHKGPKGTSRPTRYITLYDQSGFSGDEIQLTTYYLCHLFPRCLKSVSVVAPVLYAHHAAKHARYYLNVIDKNNVRFGEKEITEEQAQVINQEISVRQELKNTLYFI